MTRYKYSGPLTGATVDGRELMLVPGSIVELDPSDSYTVNLIALRRLKPAPIVISLDDVPIPIPAPSIEPAPRRTRR